MIIHMRLIRWLLLECEETSVLRSVLEIVVVMMHVLVFLIGIEIERAHMLGKHVANTAASRSVIIVGRGFLVRWQTAADGCHLLLGCHLHLLLHGQ